MWTHFDLLLFRFLLMQIFDIVYFKYIIYISYIIIFLRLNLVFIIIVSTKSNLLNMSLNSIFTRINN